MDRRPLPRRFPRRLALVACALALLLAALPASAYTIYLKDGSRIIARDKYTVRGDQAFFVLQNGTSTTIALAEIDVPRSERANEANLGTAVVIEGGETRDVPTPVEPEVQPSLGDLARERPAVRPPATRPPATRPPARLPDEGAPPSAGEAGAAFGRTPAGYPDLLAAPRRPYPNLDLVATLKNYFNGQGIDGAQVFQGSREGLPMVEITTASEASVFRALAVAASALITLREQGRSLDAIELFLATASRERAGQFLLTPELARSLLDKEVDVATFYVENVQF